MWDIFGPFGQNSVQARNVGPSSSSAYYFSTKKLVNIKPCLGNLEILINSSGFDFLKIKDVGDRGGEQVYSKQRLLPY